MTRAGSGLSANPDSAAAAREAIEEAMAEAKLDAASLVFCSRRPDTCNDGPRWSPPWRRERAARASSAAPASAS